MNRLQANAVLTHLISYYMFIIFSVCCIVYYFQFVAAGIDSHEPIRGFFYPANIIDHYIYLENYENLKNGNVSFVGINNIGIAFVYYVYFSLLELMGVDIIPERLSLILNLFVFLLCFISFKRIVRKLNLDAIVTWLFVFNCSFWYFAQLINKDVFTIFILFKLIEYALYNNKAGIFLIFLFSCFIRIQLPAIICVYLFFIYTKPTIRNLFIAYLSISIFNGYISRYQTLIIDESTLSDGFSAFIYQMNINYGIGSLLFNPVRIAQSLYSVLSSFDFTYEYGIDVSKLKNIPQVIIFIILSPWIIRVYVRYNLFMRTKAKYVMAIVPAFFLVWLLNPTINSRYVMLIIPALILIGLYSLKFGKKIIYENIDNKLSLSSKHNSTLL
ncbi:hypothetical protein REJ49_003971 [Citrobacter farmeri]|nr:hypothetical protein [Citrobacter farmeri]MBS5978847.1 hypothetical protein [Dysgonomonas mossii]